MQFPFNYILHPVPQAMYGIERKTLLTENASLSLAVAVCDIEVPVHKVHVSSWGCPQAPRECHLHGKQQAAPGECFSSYNSSLMRRGKGGSVLNYKGRMGNP